MLLTGQVNLQLTVSNVKLEGLCDYCNFSARRGFLFSRMKVIVE